MPSLLTASARSFTTREAPLLVPLYDQRFGPWQIAGDGSFVCGAAKTANISIQQASIQQQHCRFDYQDGRLTVVRLEGRVWVNESPCTVTPCWNRMMSSVWAAGQCES